jgi:hypothetical protein
LPAEVTWADSVGDFLFFMSHPDFFKVSSDPKVLNCIQRKSLTTSFHQIADIVQELKDYEKTAHMFFKSKN